MHKPHTGMVPLSHPVCSKVEINALSSQVYPRCYGVEAIYGIAPECWLSGHIIFGERLGTSRVSVTNNSPITFCISSSSGKLSLVGTYNTGSGTGEGRYSSSAEDG